MCKIEARNVPSENLNLSVRRRTRGYSRFFASAPFTGPSGFDGSFFAPAITVDVAVSGVEAAGITDACIEGDVPAVARR